MNRLAKNIAAILTFGRPPLVFGSFMFAIWVMFTQDPLAYLLGLIFLSLAMAFDWVDGWFAVRYLSHSRLGPWVDRVMDRIVLSIIFPVLVAGIFWRLSRLEDGFTEKAAQGQLLHALFVLAICVLVLMRDQVVQFLRSFALAQQDMESSEVSRARVMLASPMAVLLYAHAFYLPTDGWEWLYRELDWINDLPLRVWFVLEMAFLVVNIGTATLYMRKFGPLALDDICEDDELLRRRILSIFPNSITLLNGFLGIIAIIFASSGRVREALFLLIGAAFFDRLDGVLARRLGLTDPPKVGIPQRRFPLGAVLDDISDFISFCIAPAAIYAIVILELPSAQDSPLPLWIVPWVYLIAGATRLIYFTLDRQPIPGFFKGMPVPAAALLTGGAIVIAHEQALGNAVGIIPPAVTATAVMLTAAVVMNLFPVHYLHIGRLMGRKPIVMWGCLALTVVTIFTPYFGHTLFFILSMYLISPLFTWRIDPADAVRETRTVRSS